MSWVNRPITYEEIFALLKQDYDEATTELAEAQAQKKLAADAHGGLPLKRVKIRDLKDAVKASRAILSVEMYERNNEGRDSFARGFLTSVERSGIESTRKMYYSGRNTHPQADKSGRDAETRVAQLAREEIIEKRPQISAWDAFGNEAKKDPDLIKLRWAGRLPCDYCAETILEVFRDLKNEYPNSRFEVYHKDPNMQKLGDENALMFRIAEDGRVFGPPDPETGKKTATSTYGNAVTGYPAETVGGTLHVREDFTGRKSSPRDPYRPIQEPVFAPLKKTNTTGTEQTYANQGSGSDSNEAQINSSGHNSFPSTHSYEYEDAESEGESESQMVTPTTNYRYAMRDLSALDGLAGYVATGQPIQSFDPYQAHQLYERFKEESYQESGNDTLPTADYRTSYSDPDGLAAIAAGQQNHPPDGSYSSNSYSSHYQQGYNSYAGMSSSHQHPSNIQDSRNYVQHSSRDYHVPTEWETYSSAWLSSTNQLPSSNAPSSASGANAQIPRRNTSQGWGRSGGSAG